MKKTQGMSNKMKALIESKPTKLSLNSPTAMPKASGFLWNKNMMIQGNCRGFAVAQFMQPEPAKYCHAPNLEAKTFMQPEQPYFAHHPGRFFYIKDEDTQTLFSVPYEPVRKQAEDFVFSQEPDKLSWQIKDLDLSIELNLSLPSEDVLELWQLSIKNIGKNKRNISVYPYFPIGYMSWMNQSAAYDDPLQGIVAKCVTPYQKVEDYFKNKHFKDLSFFLAEQKPDGFETKRETFEGEGGLHQPSALQQSSLDNGDCLYETPIACLQYRLSLDVDEKQHYRFIFGPAHNTAEIKHLKQKYLSEQGFAQAQSDYKQYLDAGRPCIKINTGDQHFDNFVNTWLPRQVFYHGDVNRLSTDPQTRNYLQDNMGMSYIKPELTKAAFLHALSQQESSGAIPDGILLSEQAELKYINQIPHTDHCIWLPVCLRAYLDETNDYDIFSQQVRQFKGSQSNSAFERINLAMRWLANEKDERGLSYIAQGDWCDPMNMVGYKGKGVSGWLSVASAYALNTWADICEKLNKKQESQEFRYYASAFNDSVNQHIWDGAWYARGISDDGIKFGISEDEEGRIFLNPQSWAILAGTADKHKTQSMIAEVEAQLETPFGVMMLAPAYTGMRDNVGRVTQKHPGSAENGSVYNHAAIFYIFSLYQIGETEKAYKLLKQMIPGPDTHDLLQRGQMPNYIPNYYRGAYYQHPRTAGRSSQLFNTGTVSWLYRSIIECLFGLKGTPEGLEISPQLPEHWQNVSISREFRQAHFDISMTKSAEVKEMKITLDGENLEGNVVRNIEAGQYYKLDLVLP